MGKYTVLAEQIISNVGGKENISSLTHCVTRLRFQLKDESQAQDDVLKGIDGVITVMKTSGQYQVVIGNHVPEVYKEVTSQAGIENKSPVEDVKKQKLGEKALDLLSGIIMPTIGILSASGILKGLNVLLIMFGVLTEDAGLYQLFAAAADAMFLFFPVFLGYNAFKKLGGNPFLGMALGAAMCYPTIQNIDLNIFGNTVNTGYFNTVIPIVLLSFIAVPLEKFLNKVIPDVVKTFVTPALVLLIAFPLGFILIPPAANWLASLLALFFEKLYNFSPLITSAVMGGLWQVLVVFGVHIVLAISLLTNVIAGNPQPLLAITAISSFVQTGAVLAIWLRTKDKKLKQVALPAWISGIFGVTEPAIYGVTLPHFKHFVFTCIGGAVVGGVASIFGITMYTVAGMGVFGIPGLLDTSGGISSLVKVLLLVVIALVIGFLPSFLTFKDKNISSDEPISEGKQSEATDITLVSPLTGQVLPLSAVEDKAFSDGLLGKGVAIEPKVGQVCAPADGTIMTLFPTKHAIGIVTDTGAQVLIHLGLDTVRLDGEFFEAHIKQGDAVKQGDKLITFDIDAIKAAGYSLVTPIIITNTDDYLDVISLAKEQVETGDELLTLLN